MLPTFVKRISLVRSLAPALTGAVTLFGAACGSSSDAVEGGGGGANCPPPMAVSPGEPKTVVAKVEGTDLTLGDIDKGIAPQLQKARMDYETALYETRKAALDAEVERRVLTSEAKKRGLAGPDALLAAEVDQKVAAPSDEELHNFYNANQDRMQGASFDEIKDRISEYLSSESKRTRRSELVAGLKKTYGAKVLLEPQRVPVEAKGPTRGNAAAKITVVEFADFECPYCAQTAPTMLQLEKDYPNDVKVIFRHYPLSFHEHAGPAAEAAACADKQGKFWEVHDKLFDRSVGLDQASVRTFLATVSGFDVDAWDKCLSSGQGADAVKADMQAAEQVGVDGTPAFFVNGVKLGGARPYEDFKAIIDDELARGK